MEQIRINHASGKLDLAIRKLPLVAGGCATNNIEHIKAKLCVSPATRKSQTVARNSQ